MDIEVDIINTVANSQLTFNLNPFLWDEFDDEIFNEINNNWGEVKFLEENLSKNEQMSSLPNDKGGIYVFIAKPNKILGTHLYLMYVGRAHFTDNQNLRKRCSEYVKQERPKIKRMINQWGKYLYIRYLPLQDNDLIDKIEAELINKILPPCNDKIPDKKISAAVKAFSI